MIRIRVSSNGATVNDGEGSAVYRYDEDDLGGLQELLFDICETLSPMNSRYSKQRISVQIVHGDKYECNGCEICRQDAK